MNLDSPGLGEAGELTLSHHLPVWLLHSSFFLSRQGHLPLLPHAFFFLRHIKTREFIGLYFQGVTSAVRGNRGGREGAVSAAWHMLTLPARP